MRIACDMDDVLAGLVDPFLVFYNREHETCFGREDIITYDFWEHIGCTKEEAVERMNQFYTTPAFRRLPVIEGAVEGVSALSDFELYIVTARPKSIEGATKEWVDEHFPERFSEIRFANTWTDPSEKRGKSGLCKSLGAELIVEDCLAYAVECAANGVRAVLLDRPWNQGTEPEGVVRVYSWREAVSVING
tara:strand:+ start:6058 stop:6630 length:573 start_codon:yes stop_codon:yes gene_type:complete